MLVVIQRTLACQDPCRGQVVVHEDDIVSIVGPVVILGDPGLRKICNWTSPAGQVRIRNELGSVWLATVVCSTS